MSQYATKSTLDGLYKEVYADGIINLIPESAILVKKIPFVGKEKQNGKYYNQPAILTNEAGFTYNSDGSSFALNNHITMTMGNCQVPGYEMLLRSGMSYQAAKAAAKGKKAFVEGTSLIFENMLESMTKRLEIAMLYGRGHIAKSDESVAATTTPTSTTMVLTVAEGEWAAGIWGGLENSQVVLYGNSALISSGDDSIFTVTSSDADNKTITLTGTTTGITAVDSAIGSAYDLSVYFYGAKEYSMYSAKEQIQASSSLFGINPSVYNLFKGNSVPTSGQATLAKLLGWVNKAVSRGLNEKVIVLCNPATWADLAADFAVVQRADSAIKKGKQGVESLEYAAINGKIEIIPHLFCKEGDMFILPEKRIKRVGECDIDFMSAAGDGRIFFDVPGNAGVEMRCYSSQALFIEQPAKCVYVSGIQNSN